MESALLPSVRAPIHLTDSSFCPKGNFFCPQNAPSLCCSNVAPKSVKEFPIIQNACFAWSQRRRQCKHKGRHGLGFRAPRAAGDSALFEEEEMGEAETGQTTNGSARTEQEPDWPRGIPGQGVSGKVIGVLGGGQLGRMLCQAASPLGIRVAVLDPLPDAPAGPIAFRHVIGSFKDAEAVKEFARKCDILTFEIEHVNVDALFDLEEEGVDIEPKPSTLQIIQDKYLQKLHFRHNGVALADFVKISDREDVSAAAAEFGFPLMLKSRRDAYDGRGNAAVQSEDDIDDAIAALGGVERGLYAEKWAPYVKELAVMVARSRDGTVQSFPLVETTHKDNICHTVAAPAPVSSEIQKAALQVAETAISSLQGAGVFGVELFLLPDGQVLLNEVAPRPHNSGHFSIEACHVSQYEQHLRAILELPLGDSSLKVGAAAMYNILGEADGEDGFAIANGLMSRALAVPGASIHWYNKEEMRTGRKMGHITVVGPSPAVVSQRMRVITAAAADVAGPDSSSSSVDVAIVMGSDSDLPVMRAAAQILDFFEVKYELTIVSAHRTPDRMFSFARAAHKKGIKAIIAGAGGAAHLPGMVASLSPLPVIGVPVKASAFDGLDSTLSILQMPRGIPVATVAVNNAANAGLLAVRILAASNPTLLERMINYQIDLESIVLEKASKLESEGWQEYLKNYEGQ